MHASVFYSNGLRTFDTILLFCLQGTCEYNKRTLLKSFSKLKQNLDCKFIERQEPLFDNSNDQLVNELLQKAEAVIKSDELSVLDFKLSDFDLPTQYALYWILATVYCEWELKFNQDSYSYPYYSGVSFGEYWAVTMGLETQHFSYREYILMAYEYGKIISETQDDAKKPLLHSLATSFASKYFSDYISEPLRAFGYKNAPVNLDSIRNNPNFLTARQTNSLVEVVAKSFYDVPDEELLRKKISEETSRFPYDEYVEF